MDDTAADVARWVRAFQAEVAEHRDRLTQLDSPIGDADHGTNMDRGMRAVVAKLDGGEATRDIGALLKIVGMTLVSTVGGASGPLYGTLFLRMGTAASGRVGLDGEGWASALDAGVEGVQARGKALPGDKTMVDALVPASDAFRAAVERGASAAEAWHGAAVAARAGVRATTPPVCSPARAAPATWARAAPGTRTPAPRPATSSCGAGPRCWAAPEGRNRDAGQRRRR